MSDTDFLDAGITGNDLSLFEAIEGENETVIAGLLTQITIAARQDGMKADDVLAIFEAKDITLGDALVAWIKRQFSDEITDREPIPRSGYTFSS